MKRSIMLASIIVIVFVLPGALQAQARERCFVETGECLSGPILRYWERNGGLRTFGFPLTHQRLETAEGRELQVQWFERDRLEIQNDGLVTAGRLGARFLERGGRPWQHFTVVAQADPGCQYFAITAHQVCEPFLHYWRTQGGLERYGYPITERIDEQVEGTSYQVQYFERRRMEWHPELAGTPYEVLLGRLGAELVATDSCVPLVPEHEPVAAHYRDLLGCPLAPGRELVGATRLVLRPIPLVTQQFEGGTLIWLRQFAGDVIGSPEILMVTASRGGLIWQRFADSWQEGQPTGVVDRPPSGRYAPQRGFGFLWANNAEVRNKLGWALAPEQGGQGGYRRFTYGFLAWQPLELRYYLIIDDQQAVMEWQP